MPPHLKYVVNTAKLVRQARIKKVASAKPEYVFIPPLRIMAVLGASGSDEISGISAKDEWEEF